MGMGICSDNEFEKELINTNRPNLSRSDVKIKSDEIKSDEVIEGEVVDITKPSRGKGNVEVPESLRKLIGETAITHGREEALKLAEMFHVSASSVSAYTKGATSTASYNEPNKELTKVIKGAKSRIVNKAKKKLSLALDNITDEKLANAKLKDLATVINATSAVIERLDESPREDTERKPLFVVFAPQVRNENHFETINLNE